MHGLLAISNQGLWARWAARSVEFFSFKYGFVADALLASVTVGVMCGLVGTFLVLRRLSLLGDAAGHSALPGLCVAFIVTGSLGASALMFGALGSALLASLVVGWISRGPRSRPDAAIGIVLSGFFGLGTLLLSYIQRTATTSYAGLDSLLLGNVAGISPGQLHLLLAVAGALIAALVVFWRPLVLSTFDEGFARGLGVPVRAIHYGLLMAMALSVVVSIQAVGVVLISAMLIIPGSAALFLSRRLPLVAAWAALIGGVSGMAGAYLSYIQEGLATGPAMVLVASALFLLAMVFGPRRGVLVSLRSRGIARAAAPAQEVA